MPICVNFWLGLKACNLFRLLKNETFKIFSIRERRKNRYKFGGTKVCKVEEVKNYFLNPKLEVELFSYIICSSDFKNILCPLFLFNMKIMNGVISWCMLALYHIFHSAACVSFFSIFFLLSFSITSWSIEVSLVILKLKQWSCLRFLSDITKGDLVQLYLVIDVTCLIEPTEPVLVWEKF